MAKGLGKRNYCKDPFSIMDCLGLLIPCRKQRTKRYVEKGTMYLLLRG